MLEAMRSQFRAKHVNASMFMEDFSMLLGQDQLFRAKHVNACMFMEDLSMQHHNFHLITDKPEP
jgi:hypothetical protein